MNDADWGDAIRNAFVAAWHGALDRAPVILGSVVLLAVGWLVARLLRALTERSVVRAGAWIAGNRVDTEIRAAGIDRLAPPAAGLVVFWIVFLLFVALAGEVLGLDVGALGLERLVEYMPTLLGAAVVVFVGIVAANLVRTMVVSAAARASVTYGEVLGQVLRWVILLVTAVVALDQVGIDSELLITATNVLIASVVGGSALAFALGSRTTVGNILAMHYVVQTYRVGQRIRIEGLEGEIVEFKKTGVVIAGEDGRVLVPAIEFSERRSTLVGGGRS